MLVFPPKMTVVWIQGGTDLATSATAIEDRRPLAIIGAFLGLGIVFVNGAIFYNLFSS